MALRPNSQNKSKRWALTVHGATDEQLTALKTLFDMDTVDFGIASKESGEHSIHPHFQVYFECVDRCRMKQTCKDLFGSNFHLEHARGTRDANVRYVYGVDKAYEIGWIVLSKGSVEVPRGYSPHAMNFTRDFKPRPFQKHIIDIINSQKPDDRTIYWFWEPNGNVGKTALAKWLHRTYGAIVAGGSSADIKHALARVRDIVGSDPTVILVDLVRSYYPTKQTYTAIENIKDGIFFSGKYESAMLDMKSSPDIFVFCNFEPIIDRLSLDRWKIFKINPDYTCQEQPISLS